MKTKLIVVTVFVIVISIITAVTLAIVLPKQQSAAAAAGLIDATLVETPQIVTSAVMPCTQAVCQNKVQVVLTWKKKAVNSVVSIQRQGANAIITTAFSLTDTQLSANATYVYEIKYVGAYETSTHVVEVGDFDAMCATLSRKDNVNNVCVDECSGKGARNADKLCECNAGFSGALCQYSDALTCGGHGTVNTDGVCACKPGYAGPGCQYSDALTCGGHGTVNAAGACACTAGYAGPRCQYSDAVTCGGHGTVKEDGSCTCDYNHVGVTCTTEVPLQFTNVSVTQGESGINVVLAVTGKAGSPYKLRLRGASSLLTSGTFDDTGNASFMHVNQSPVLLTYEIAYNVDDAEWVSKTISRYSCDGEGGCVLTDSTDLSTTFATAAECTCYTCASGKCVPVDANVKGSTTYELCKNASSCEWTRYACNGQGGCVLTGSTDVNTTFATAGDCKCYSCKAGTCIPVPANTKGLEGVGCSNGCSLNGTNETAGTIITPFEMDSHNSSLVPVGADDDTYPLRVLLPQLAGPPGSDRNVRFLDTSYTSPRFKYYPMFIFTAKAEYVELNSNGCWVNIKGGYGSDTAQVQTVLIPWENDAPVPPSDQDATTSRAFEDYSFSNIPLSTDVIATAGSPDFANGRETSNAAPGFKSYIAPVTIGKQYAIAAEVLVATDDYITIYWDQFTTGVPAVKFTTPMLSVTMSPLKVLFMKSSSLTVYSMVLTPNALITMKPGVTETRYGELSPRLWFDSDQMYTNPSSSTPSVSIGFKIESVNAASTTVSINIQLGVYEVTYGIQTTPVNLDIPKNVPARLGVYAISTSYTYTSPVLDFSTMLTSLGGSLATTFIGNTTGQNVRKFTIYPAATVTNQVAQPKSRPSKCVIS